MTGQAALTQTRRGPEISATARTRLRAYIDALPAVRVMALYDQIQAGQVADQSLAATKEIFVASLNGSRPQRAQRLFYEFFSPVLAEDRVLAGARRQLPALSSPRVRSASRSAERSGRLTSTSVVIAGSESWATVAA